MQSIPSFGSSNGSTARHAASSTGLWEMQQPKRRPAKLWCCTRRAAPALHVGKLGTAVADAACCVSIVKCSLVPPPLVITENSPACPKRKQTKDTLNCTGSTAANHVLSPTQLIKGFIMWRKILRRPSRFCSKMQSGYNRCIYVCMYVCMCMYVCTHTHVSTLQQTSI